MSLCCLWMLVYRDSTTYLCNIDGILDALLADNQSLGVSTDRYMLIL